MIAALFLVVVVVVLAFRRAGSTAWSLALVLYLLLLSQLDQASDLQLTLCGVPLLLLLLLCNHASLRRRLLVRPLRRRLQTVLPEISATEQAAIDAGSVSWDGELFQPKPDWRQLFAYPAPRLSAAEQAFLDGPVERLCALLDDWQINQQQDLPRQVWRFIKRERLFGLVIPQRFGGHGFSTLAHSEVVMKLSTRSISAAVTVMVPNSLGPAELLLRYGTEQQQRYYLPRLARGTEIPCFALTSPVAGSDAGAITDRGVVCYGEWQGKRVLGFRLDWDKRYITLAPIATLLGLAFKAYDPDHLLGAEEALGITCALVPATTPGVIRGARHRPMNSAFMNGPTQGKQVFIPMTQVIGGSAQIGKGWSMLMNCLAIGRAVSLPALSTGAGKLACQSCGDYALLREQFNTPIGEFEGVAAALAPIAGLTYRMEAARRLTVMLVDMGEHPSVPSAILKYHNTEAMRQVINHAMDIHGGRAIMEGPRNYLARIYTAIPISITVEGANILTRAMMIFGQGALRCHPYLLTEIEALRDPIASRAEAALDQALTAHLRRNLQAASRALLLGLWPGLAAVPGGDPRSRRALRRLEHLNAAFVLIAEATLLLLGGQLKLREALSARLSDSLGLLYLASALLKHYRDSGCPVAQQVAFDWAMAHTLHQLQEALLGVCDNLPAGWLGRLLKRWCFPRGGLYPPPSDALTLSLAGQLLHQEPTRQELTRGLYLNPHSSDPLGRLLLARQAKLAAAPLLQRLRDAQRAGQLERGPLQPALLAKACQLGVLTPSEAAALEQLLHATSDACAVDSFG